MSKPEDRITPLDKVQEAFPDMSPNDAVKFTETCVAVADNSGTDVQTVIDEAAQANK